MHKAVQVARVTAIMGNGKHHYEVTITWAGNLGTGTSGYRDYSRDHLIDAPGKPTIAGSSDPAFRGDRQRWNPEDLLVASLSACHKLWYLHLCSENGIVVLAYTDTASGHMVEEAATGGRFTLVVLRPHVTIRAQDDADLAVRLHHDAHTKCFIANSVNFAVDYEPSVQHDAQI